MEDTKNTGKSWRDIKARYIEVNGEAAFQEICNKISIVTPSDDPQNTSSGNANAANSYPRLGTGSGEYEYSDKGDTTK